MLYQNGENESTHYYKPFQHVRPVFVHEQRVTYNLPCSLSSPNRYL